MAVIGKIRERSGLLLLIIGGALVAFILTDLFAGRGSGLTDQVIGEVGGNEIGMREFERRVDMELETYRVDFGQTINNQITEQVRSTVWGEMVKELAMLGKVRDAGFTLTKGEYDDIRFGENIIPEYRNQQQFQTPDGSPDRQGLQQYFENIQLKAPVWNEIVKRRIIENRLYAKYTTLVKKSVFVNSAQANAEYLTKNERVSFNFVAKRYDSEPDSLFAASEKDLRRFYDQHRSDARYKQKPGRRFEFVTFPVAPSDADAAAMAKELDGLRIAFETTDNDSTFVVRNSEARVFNKAPYVAGTADAMNDSLITNAQVGEVVGPYREGDRWKLAKVLELVDIPEVRVRHILLGTQNGQDEAAQKKRADSLVVVIKRDRKKFEDLNTKFTDDPGGKSNGGDYGFFDKDKSFVQEFKDAGFNNPVGWIGVVKTEFGFHVIEVMEKRTRNERRVATVERTMKPSPATFKLVYKKANDFSLRHSASAEAFRAGAEELGLALTPVEDLRPDARSVAGLQDAAEVIRWVNQSNLGEVSAPKVSGDNYVVAIITGIRDEGAPQLEDVRELFTREVVKEKKAEHFMGLMQGKTDLSALASELGLGMQTASDMQFSTFAIPGGFSEFEVIGKLFALGNGNTSVPMKGETAVYVAQITNVAEAPAPTDLGADRDILLQRLQSRVDNAVYAAMREAAGVKDHRSKFY